eukprot:364933-Chlamydomonas_euryale.AAC.27
MRCFYCPKSDSFTVLACYQPLYVGPLPLDMRKTQHVIGSRVVIQALPEPFLADLQVWRCTPGQAGRLPSIIVTTGASSKAPPRESCLARQLVHQQLTARLYIGAERGRCCARDLGVRGTTFGSGCGRAPAHQASCRRIPALAPRGLAPPGRMNIVDDFDAYQHHASTSHLEHSSLDGALEAPGTGAFRGGSELPLLSVDTAVKQTARCAGRGHRRAKRARYECMH